MIDYAAWTQRALETFHRIPCTLEYEDEIRHLLGLEVRTLRCGEPELDLAHLVAYRFEGRSGEDVIGFLGQTKTGLYTLAPHPSSAELDRRPYSEDTGTLATVFGELAERMWAEHVDGCGECDRVPASECGCDSPRGIVNAEAESALRVLLAGVALMAVGSFGVAW